MLFSIIIPTCNRNELLSKCLDLIMPQILMSTVEYEIIVSDDSKDDQAQKLIAENYSIVKWVQGPKRGPAANRNNGAKQAAGEWLIFLDDDCLPSRDWLSAYVKAININMNTFVFEGFTNADRLKKRFDEEAPINIDGNKLWSCNFCILKKLFVSLGCFDEGFPSAAMEDVDFYIRVVKDNKIVFVPEAVVIHPWRRVKFFKNFRKHLNSQKFYADKYKISGTKNFRIDRLKIFIGSIYFDFISLCKFSLRGWPSYFEKCIFNFFMIFL